MNNFSTLRINISFPSELVKDIKKRVAEGEFSKFLADAAREKIESMERDMALKKLLNSKPAFPRIKNASKWVRDLRSKDTDRLKRFGIA